MLVRRKSPDCSLVMGFPQTGTKAAQGTIRDNMEGTRRTRQLISVLGRRRNNGDTALC